MIYSLFCPGVGVLSHVPCPMWSFSKCTGPTFIHWYMWWRGHAWNCTDCMKHKISMVGFYCCCCCCFFYLCSTCIVGFGYVVGRAGGGRVLGVNIVKYRNATT